VSGWPTLRVDGADWNHPIRVRQSKPFCDKLDGSEEQAAKPLGGRIVDETSQGSEEQDWNWREPLKSLRRWMSSDDILSGFGGKDSSEPEIRTFFVSTIATAMVAWDIAFNLGAFHTVFFARRHQLAVVLFVVVLGTLALRRQVHVHWWVLTFLSIPFAWIIFRLIFSERDSGQVTGTVDSGFLIAIIVIYPVAFWIVLRLMAPDYFEIPNLRLKIASFTIVLVIAGIAFLVGEFNNRFLSCEEFAVSGNDLPADCAESP